MSFFYVQGAKITVVDSQDLIKILMIHAKMYCLRDAAGNTYVEVNSGGAAVIARAVQAQVEPIKDKSVRALNAILAPPRAPFVLPDNAFIVSSRNDSMYGKRMRDVHIAGYLVQSETVIRFRKRDHKVMPADMMVGVGKYDTYTNANRAVQNFMRKNDDKVSDLTSMEVDKTLSIEQVNFFCTVIQSWYKNIFNKKIVCTHSYVKRYKLFI